MALIDFLKEKAPDRAVIHLRSDEELIRMLQAVDQLGDDWSKEKFIEEGIRNHYRNRVGHKCLRGVKVGHDLQMTFDGQLGDADFPEVFSAEAKNELCSLLAEMSETISASPFMSKDLDRMAECKRAIHDAMREIRAAPMKLESGSIAAIMAGIGPALAAIPVVGWIVLGIGVVGAVVVAGVVLYTSATRVQTIRFRDDGGMTAEFDTQNRGPCSIL